MTIAYLIQVYKNSEQIKSLISCLLNNDKHHGFIHVDKKNEDLYQALRRKYANHQQVHIIEDRVIVNWSGFSQVEATLLLMRNVHCSNIRFDRI
ncbi:MAG: N-acetylglucosaminyltransferase, partial [Epsilonproteobacteria bacterium]|nr:N-acetylglucosaminyltransferase [Campylobacterota bacterium]